MKIENVQKDRAASVYLLTHNETELRVTVDPKEQKINTHITRTFLAPRVPGTVTDLYREAAQLMQQEATERHMPLTYVYATRNDHMKEWARATEKGEAIFQWDTLEEKNETLVGEKIIFPSPSE